MKRSAKIVACFGCGFLLSTGIYAKDGVSPNSSDAPVVARDIFGLSPPSVPKTEPEPPSQPPKITPNGIMSIFGQRQALFKVTDISSPGQPAKDTFYTLGEGEQQDGIEVTHIDESAGIVTFNNHGTLQEISLAEAAEAADAAPTPWIMGRGNIGNRGFHGPDLNGNLPPSANDSAPNAMTPETQTILLASQPAGTK